MARRTFRYVPELDKFVEITRDATEGGVHVIGEDGFTPFRSVVDGTWIESRSHMRRYMAERGLVHHAETTGAMPERDRYQAERDTRALRERLWEGVSKTFSMGTRPRR
jgi:hypothetical protein